MILKVAVEVHADVIAMSTHGRSGVQRWLMGVSLTGLYTTPIFR
jgi:nucleotide-binding universal stress UspA family protein